MAKLKTPGNLDDVQAGFEPVPDADYPIRIESYDVRQADKGPNIFWQSEIFGADDPKLNGRKLFFNTSLAADALWKVKEMLEATGVKWDKDGFDPEDVKGKECVARVRTREWEGEPRNEVKKLSPLKRR